MRIGCLTPFQVTDSGAATSHGWQVICWNLALSHKIKQKPRLET
jgi:hypothetical protein